MGTEKRQHERKPLRMGRCEGTFTMEVQSAFHEISQVQDISISGMGVILSVYVDPGRPVKIFYAEDDHVVSLTGTVTWCGAHSPNSSLFRVGIFFDDLYRDANCSFHVIMSRYLT